jgi:hypothetical protein
MGAPRLYDAYRCEEVFSGIKRVDWLNFAAGFARRTLWSNCNFVTKERKFWREFSRSYTSTACEAVTGARRHLGA